jgi:tRNA A-37 threonylcarbamoyl transferase component Bud32
MGDLDYNFAMADWAGRKLGKVQISELVARGGTAEIYRGVHDSHGHVAVKVMRGLLEHDPNQLARFKREAKVIGALRHPNIVRMLDYFVEDETPCLAMEYIEGPSLAAYMKALHERGQRLPIGAASRIITAVASALDYAHSKGMIHRDIKPANVLLRSPTQKIDIERALPSDVEPILTDFGLVRLLDSTIYTASGSVSGTPAYMSPEQARGDELDSRTDIYSLGIMLYEMLAGKVPFHADTTFGMLMKHINEPPPPIEGISSDLQALLDRALAKDPALRYATAGELANEFLAIFNGQPISSETLYMVEMARKGVEVGQPAPRTVEQFTRSRWIRIGAGIFVIAGIALLVVRFLALLFTPALNAPEAFDPDIPVGRMRFYDFNNVMDRVSFVLTKATPPEQGTHLRAWLVGDNRAAIRNIGVIRFDAGGTGQLVFTDPDRQNLLKNYGEILITKEQNDVSISKPTGEVIYSSIFPPQSLLHVRHVLVSYDKTPDNLALMQGLYYFAASYINIVVNGNELEPGFMSLVKAYETGDEAALRKRAEEVINLIAGDNSELFLDYDRDGNIDDNDGDGYGSLPNGDRSGYLRETSLHVNLAAEAPDSTSNIRLYSENIQICIQNMDGWTNQLLSLTLQLVKMPFGPNMKPIVDEMSILSRNLVNGRDANGNGLIDPLAGECGADAVYEYGWYMADMYLFPGADRIPPSGK